MLTNLEIKYEGRNLIPKLTKCSERLEWIPNLQLQRLLDGSLYIDKKRYFKRRLTVEGIGLAPNIKEIPDGAKLIVRTGARVYSERNIKGNRVKIEMITSNYQIKIDENGNITWIWQMEEI